MRINAITQMIQSELKKIDNAKKGSVNSSESQKKSEDKTEISEVAKKLSSENTSIESITATVNSHPEIRIEKIEEIREKILSGYYDSPEFLDKLATKLLEEFGIKEELSK